VETSTANHVERRPLRFAILGAGMSGLLAAVRLSKSGDRDFTIYEKGGKVGGTWRENRYPGLTCDVPSHSYTYSFAPNPDWSRYYAGGSEIQRYFESITDRYGLREHIRFNTEIESCRYVDGRWHITAAGGEHDVVDVVIAATGVLHHPRVPEIDGIGDFAGPCFHSARWPDGLETDGRRVGIVGNGSTGVQLVTALAGKASRLVHFQRTPQWIVQTADFAYTDQDRAAFRADPEKLEGQRNSGEYWAGYLRFNKAILDLESPEMAEIEALARKNLEENVHDPVLREKLRPTYRAMCKRLIFSPNYYEAIQHPTASVETGRIARIEPEGIRMSDGSLHGLDIIVLATGFQVERFVRPIRVVGRQGVRLDELWRDRPTAYYAISVPDFPNFFMLNGPTGPVGNFSLIEVAEMQWAYIEHLVALLRDGRAREIAVKREALEDYDHRRSAAAMTTVFASGCKSWYLDSRGVPQTWPWTYAHFSEVMERPKLADYEIS
jgi:cation diffusion facilitator CzcD-associated flavoprotein CzcO